MEVRPCNAKPIVIETKKDLPCSAQPTVATVDLPKFYGDSSYTVTSLNAKTTTSVYFCEPTTSTQIINRSNTVSSLRTQTQFTTVTHTKLYTETITSTYNSPRPKNFDVGSFFAKLPHVVTQTQYETTTVTNTVTQTSVKRMLQICTETRVHTVTKLCAETVIVHTTVTSLQ